jgi:alkanesulfonate monooxygenase SsuD/methylene tetrahydromethanopterin reductase-like flavin-dependent oxidoreductase (luciferase family)
MLAEAYPGRLVLGLGSGYPQQAAAAHLAAGADHVVLLPPSSASMAADLMTGVAQLEQLAPAVLQSR